MGLSRCQVGAFLRRCLCPEIVESSGRSTIGTSVGVCSVQDQVAPGSFQDTNHGVGIGAAKG
jgi:hypothetical protein